MKLCAAVLCGSNPPGKSRGTTDEYLARVSAWGSEFRKLLMRLVKTVQLDLEWVICGPPRQDVDVTIVDQLQHGAEHATDLCLASLLRNCLKV